MAFFKKLPHCLVGIEACATSHHWSREPTKAAAIALMVKDESIESQYHSRDSGEPTRNEIASKDGVRWLERAHST